jgi:alginate O-acetyltransferase complex protein AlgI
VIFTQLSFFVFFIATAAVHWSLRSNRLRKGWLLLCSYFFYGYWDYRFLALILLCTSVDFFTARALGRFEQASVRRRLLVLSLCVNLGVLGFFKYFGFFVDSAVELLRAFGFDLGDRAFEIVLPVGISFFTFQSLSYTVDVYRGKLEPRTNFFDYALFVSFFPQLVAGPIVRASTFLPQLASQRSPLDVRRALLLFAVGYFKKACVADNIATIIDPVFADPLLFVAADRALASILYSVQSYCDFSGYTDMAIVVAALLGYELTRGRAASTPGGGRASGVRPGAGAGAGEGRRGVA